MYTRPPAEEPLTQGDIFDDCPVFELMDGAAPRPKGYRVRAIVLTQACDLAQDRSDRVVVAVVSTAAKIVESGLLKSNTIRDQVRIGRVYGWYFLPASSPEIGLVESVIDLRDLHTLRRSLLEEARLSGRRVARVLSPYREHLAQHFASTYSRIGLPEPYETEA